MQPRCAKRYCQVDKQTEVDVNELFWSMEMEFLTLSKLAGLLSKSFAREFLRVLMMYKSISASEAASRLDLHIKTAQDFLEGLEELGIVSKEEVFEKKRPYFRFTLLQEKLRIEFDLNQLIDTEKKTSELDFIHIKERKDSNCMFKTSPKTGALSTVSFYVGEGREKEERKINLTESQGRFLFHLPFPTEAIQSIQWILNKAEIDSSYSKEILDMVYFLGDHGIIEIVRKK